jgi:carbon-monoxide dehydrogenase medium subunit
MSLAFVQPREAGEAANALAASGARPLAGGTDLLVQLRSGRITPGSIVDLKKVPGAVGVRGSPTEGFVIGAATPARALLAETALAAAWPGVIEAANLIGSIQVRNRASLGGNLCNASPAADSVPALIAANAVCRIVGPGGMRELAVEALPTGPGKTALALGEFVLDIRLPPRSGPGADAYLRSIPRSEMDIAVAGAAVNLTLDGNGAITQARVSLGAVAPTALLVEEAGAALIGGVLDEAALARVDAAVRAACRPIDDKRGPAEYRTHMTALLARRAAKQAYARAKRAQ